MIVDKTKHTPGPWGVGSMKTNRDPIAITNDDGRVCLVDGDTDGFDRSAEQEANARLIAAAPELLAALQWVERLRAIGALKNEDGETPDFEPVHAAIAKAANLNP